MSGTTFEEIMCDDIEVTEAIVISDRQPMPLADLGGHARHMPPPMGPNSFILTYIFTEKCPHWRSMPLLMAACPPMGNPVSSTACCTRAADHWEWA